jgi:hypothetical protein
VDDHDDASEPPGSAEPAAMPEDDFDADAEMARWIADIEAGRERIPECSTARRIPMRSDFDGIEVADASGGLRCGGG